MKTCFIYSDLIIDLEVMRSMEAFYQRLGFKTCYCKDRIYDADLLVFLRPLPRPLDLSGYHHSVIHIYDYEGWEINSFLRDTKIDHEKTYIFCVSEVQKKRILSEIRFPPERIFVAYTPIEIPLWVSDLRPVKYELVHIGNHKPIPENEDPVIPARFHEAVSALKVDVWGADWEKFIGKGRYHGKAGHFEVAPLYARSHFALGLMYPHQRDWAYSSRFWQATLNGCYVLAEPSLYTSTFPGIIETDYTLADLREKLKRPADREALREQAKRFWEEQNQVLLSYVKPTLASIQERELTVKERLLFGWISIENQVHKFFHARFVPKWLRKMLIFFRDGTKPHETQSKVPSL